MDVQDSNDDEIGQIDFDSDKDQGDHDVNPPMVPLEEDMLTQEEITNKWFSQDVFAEAVEEENLGKSDSEDEMQVDRPKERHSI